MRVTVSHSQLVYYVTLFGQWEKQKIADLKFLTVTSQSTGITVLEACN